MSFKIADLFAEIRADARPLGEALTQAHGKLSLFSGALKAAAGLTAGFFTTMTLMKVARAVYEDLTTSELVTVRLAGALRGTGQEVDNNVASMRSYASEIQLLTVIENDEVTAAQQLATSLGIHADRMRETMDIAIGLSRALGMDLSSATRYSAMALQGEYAILQRYLPELRQVNTETEKLAILQKAAAAGMQIARDEASTATGQLRQLKTELIDILGEAAMQSKIPAAIAKILNIDELKAANKELRDATDHFAFLRELLAAPPTTTVGDVLTAEVEAARKRLDLAKQRIHEQKAEAEFQSKLDVEVDVERGKLPFTALGKTRDEWEKLQADQSRASMMAESAARQAQEEQQTRDRLLADQQRRAKMDVLGQIMDEDRADAEAADREGKRTEEERRRKIGVYSGIVEFSERLQSAILQGKPQEAQARVGTQDERMLEIVRQQLEVQKQQKDLLAKLNDVLAREQLDVPLPEF